jgi:protein O-GlcNAc transferase
MFNPFSLLPSWKQIEKAMGESRLDVAEVLLEEHLRLYLQDAEAWILKGYFDFRAHRLEQAEASYKQALILQPQHAEAWFNLGYIQLLQQQFQAAIESLRTTLQLNPDHRFAHQELASAYLSLGWYLHASSHLEATLKQQPDQIKAWKDICFSLYLAGQISRQQAYLREILSQLLPRRNNDSSSLSGLLPMIAQMQATLLFAAYADYAHKDDDLLALMQQAVSDGAYHSLTAAATPLKSPPLKTTPHRLRVGYLSREMGKFSSASTLLPLLENHDRSQFELFAYTDLSGEDDWTQRFQGCFEHWFNSSELSEDALKQRIQADQIEILIDLSGLIHGARLGLFALRSAPVQLTGLGFGWPTALPQMDGFFSDARLWPPELAEDCPEPLLYLSSALHWQPLSETPLTAVPSALGKPLTLGCANNLAKLNLEVMQTWAEILQALPDARLCLKTVALNDPLSQEWLYCSFEYLGISRARILLYGAMLEQDHVPWFYSQIDLALDPFPFCGGVTTLEALWMGVPVITLRSRAHLHRAVGASILSLLDLPELIADSRDHYLALTVALARSPERLEAYRSLLRPRLAGSVICNGPLFAAEVEAHLVQLWDKVQTS